MLADLGAEMPHEETTLLYRPVGSAELELIQSSGYRHFPRPPLGQPLFKPVLTRKYALEVARDWSAKERTRGYSGYITRFRVESRFLSRYSQHQVGNSIHREYWIPADDLDAFNAHIRGVIEVIAEYHGVPDGAA